MSKTQTSYGFGVQVPWNQEEAIERVTAALKTEGFGVLSTVDVQATLKEKIDVDREPYVILGACNPNLANQALQAEPEIGLLLPCNVIVYQQGGRTHVSFMDPVAALSLTGRDEIAPLASEVKTRLQRVLDAISQE
jgi:uncharacterized protein (DUF302 family)